MKRHPALQALSREHHGALQLALTARRAVLSTQPAAIDAAAARCLNALRGELEAHFLVEENTLLPLLAGAGAEHLAARLSSDHAALRQLDLPLQQGDAAALQRFAELLSAHVRFEERELFVALEAGLAGPGQSTDG